MSRQVISRPISRKPVLYMLDTNTVAYVIDGRSPAASAMLKDASQHASIAISAITAAEIFYGLAMKPAAFRFRAAVEAFLEAVEIRNWDAETAQAYGTLRAQMKSSGKRLSNMDMLIAAQAIAADAILVTCDKAFQHIEALRPVANWATDIH